MPLGDSSHTNPVSVCGRARGRARSASHRLICARRAGSLPSEGYRSRADPRPMEQATATENKPMIEGTADRHHHGPPPRRVRRTVDVHAHWYPADWLSLFERDGPAEGAKLERTASGYTLRTERIVNAFDERFVDLGLRLDGMDRQRVDVHALSLTAPMVYWASPGFGLALAQAYNDAAAAAHVSHPDRLVGLAMLPMQAPELALEELERAAKLPGMRGMYLATHVNNTDLDDRRFWDIYAKAEELGWPIFLHPIDTIGRERTTRYYLKNLLGNPYDTGVAAASLIFGGVLDAFPKLEFNLPHAGGTFPWLIGRLDHGTKVRPELIHMKQLPSAYLRRFTYDTIGHNDQINSNLIRLVGADRVVLGSDYCFDMGLEDPMGDIERLDGLTAAERDLIVGQTAVRLLRLE
jgi:aminocarboxymuconate-semialdehyde decarboxylase